MDNDVNEVINETEEQVQEKKKSNIFINIIIVLMIFLISLVMYAKYVGTKGISVKEYRIVDSAIPENFSGVKVVYFSDVLLGSTVNTEDVSLMVDRINELKPDIVLFGGGLVQDGYSVNDEMKNELSQIFSRIDVKLGKYAVKGDKDASVFDEVMASSDFIVMNNSYEFIYNEGTTPICLSSVGSYNASLYDVKASLQFYDTMPTCFSILFTHESDIILNVLESEYKPNVILAGNTLGGEIRVPFYGPISVFPGSVNYYLDYYEEGDTKIFISSGLGTKKYDMRLFNRPSFNFFRLKS